MKTAISVPDETHERVDAAAERLGISRSQFYARAAERWLGDLDHDGVTEQMNAALAAEERDQSAEDEEIAWLHAAARDLVRRGHWEW